MKKWRFRTKWLRPIFWKLLGLLPEIIRSPLIRSVFKVSLELPPDLIFKIAETQSEMEQVFKILYKEFLEHNYISKNEAELRITKYHALPSTTILIGKLKEQVICTLSVIKDSPFGLPSDSSWDLSPLRKKASHFAEISSLAICQNYQGKRGKILLPLCKFMYEFCTHSAQIDIIFISTLASVKDFYSAILLFESIGIAKPIQNSFVKNVVAFGQFLDLRIAPERYSNIYSGKPKEKDIYHYFTKIKFKQFVYPAKVFGQCVYPVISAKSLAYFFLDKLPLLSDFSQNEKLHLKNSYYHSSYEEILKLENYQFKERKEVRLPTKLFAMLKDKELSYLQPIVIVEISYSGFKAKLVNRIEMNKAVGLTININSKQKMTLKAIPIWQNNFDFFVFQFQDQTTVLWKNFVQDLLWEHQTVEIKYIKAVS